MSFLDNLESNLKSMESREERRPRNELGGRRRESERARAQASAAHAAELRNSPYTAELIRQATRMGFATRTKIHLAWLGTTLRLEARGHKLELRPTPEGILAAFIENNAEVRTARLDLSGNPESLAREWLASLPPIPPPPATEDFE